MPVKVFDACNPKARRSCTYVHLGHSPIKQQGALPTVFLVRLRPDYAWSCGFAALAMTAGAAVIGLSDQLGIYGFAGFAAWSLWAFWSTLRRVDAHRPRPLAHTELLMGASYMVALSVIVMPWAWSRSDSFPGPFSWVPVNCSVWTLTSVMLRHYWLLTDVPKKEPIARRR